MSAAPAQAIEIDVSHRAAWDALVAASPTANTFQRSAWLDMITATDSYGVQFRRVAVLDKDGTLRGAWALPYRTRASVRYSTYFEFFYAGPFLHPELESGSVHHARERLDVLQALAAAQADQLDIIEAETHPAMSDIRPLLYAGWNAQPLYTHIWDLADPDAALAAMNREKRRMIRRAGETLTFRFEAGGDTIDALLALYRNLITKFDWVPLPQWDNDLRQRLLWLHDGDGGRIFTARAPDGELKAAVIALLSPDDRTAYLWRCAYKTDPESHTVVPALYWYASHALRQEWGAPFFVNFGGSPRVNLTLFKDYLGARAVPHFRLIHDRPGLKTKTWRTARQWKETARRHATRSGLLDALYRQRRPSLPAAEPEEPDHA